VADAGEEPGAAPTRIGGLRAYLAALRPEVWPTWSALRGAVGVLLGAVATAAAFSANLLPVVTALRAIAGGVIWLTVAMVLTALLTPLRVWKADQTKLHAQRRELSAYTEPQLSLDTLEAAPESWTPRQWNPPTIVLKCTNRGPAPIERCSVRLEDVQTDGRTILNFAPGWLRWEDGEREMTIPGTPLSPRRCLLVAFEFVDPVGPPVFGWHRPDRQPPDALLAGSYVARLTLTHKGYGRSVLVSFDVHDRPGNLTVAGGVS
jgi:hypothetical protein